MKTVIALLFLTAFMTGCQKSDRKIAELESKLNALQAHQEEMDERLQSVSTNAAFAITTAGVNNATTAGIINDIHGVLGICTNFSDRLVALEKTDQIRKDLETWHLLHDPATRNLYSATPQAGKLDPATGLPWAVYNK